MPSSPSDGEGSQPEESLTLAECLLFLKNPRIRKELEAFRVSYEAEFGETDLTKRYTSTWPEIQQDWLLKHDPKRYWDGLPPFVQAFYKEKMLNAHRRGKLDDMPPSFLRLYLNGNMEVDSDGRSR